MDSFEYECDLWEDGATAKAPEYHTYGRISIDPWACVLVKGIGKVPFDAGQHSIDRRCVCYNIAITPIAGSKARFPIERQVITTSKEWYEIIWKSLQELGIKNGADLRTLPGKWAKLKLVPDGRTYTDKHGAQRESTTIWFEAIYDSEAACEAAYKADMGQGPAPSTEPATAATATTPAAAQPAPQSTGSSAPSDDAQRATARGFIQALAKQHHGDLDAIRAAAANIPLITQHYALDSDDFIQEVAATVYER